MTQDEAERLGDEYRDRVFRRTGLKGWRLECPRQKSDMTPCIAHDGGMCVVLTSRREPICVGCEADVVPLLEAERAR